MSPATATAAQPPGRRRRSSPEPPHAHDPLPDEPADWAGRRVCSGPQGCGLLGEPGDVRHPVGAPSLYAARVAAVPGDVRDRDLAIRRRTEGDRDE